MHTSSARGALAALLLPLAAGPSAADDRPVPDDWCGTGTGGMHVVVDGQIRTLEFPLKHTSVDARVSGPVARVTVTQTFQNPYEDTIEAVYVFPLPHEAAVNDLEMRIGDRTVRGIIERRDEARRLYEQARDRGHVAALLEQERPNIFTQSVANILPGNEIEVRLTYVETLPHGRDGREFVFPMVVGPRFLPPGPAGVMPAGFGQEPPRGVPDGDRLNPQFLPPDVRSGHDIDVRVRIDAGLPIRDLQSPTHRIEREGRGDRATVTLNPLDTVPNKDFVLRWRVEGEDAEAGVVAYHDGETGFLTAMIHPEIAPSEDEITPKEMIFVLDCSGSMSGEPMAAAKALVRHALRNLRPDDTFQVIRFSERASGFAASPRRATPENVKQGIAYVDGLQGQGGTMMIEGIRAALEYDADPDRLRMVMFLTDGYIGNDAEILAAVRQRIGVARLFAFGVGSSVNRHLLDRMSEEGRGEVQYFPPGSSVEDEVDRFYERVRSPYLTDIELVWEGVRVVDAYPSRVPDVFAGKPVQVTARYEGGGDARLRVRGRRAGRPYEKVVRLDLPTRRAGNPALGSLWARARIAELESELLDGADARKDQEIAQLGLRHRLVTRLTSFVAVEERMVVSNGRPVPVRVPVQMPEGVSFEGVFGDAGGPLSKGEASQATLQMQGRTRGGLASLAPQIDAPQAPGLPGIAPIAREVESKPERRDAQAQTPAMTTVQVRLSADRTEVARGDRVRLVLEITNGSRYDALVPAALLDGSRQPVLRVIDGGWNERTVGQRLTAIGKTVRLAPGETRRVIVELETGDLGTFPGPGVYHLFVVGDAFGALDSNRVTLRIR